VVAKAVLSGQTIEEMHNTQAANNRDERLWMATDQELDDLDVVVVLERLPQRGLAVGVHEAQNAWSRQRKGDVDVDCGEL